MKRWREGLPGGAFFQKQAPKGMPDWIPTRQFETVQRGGKGARRMVDFPLVNSREALLWMVQMHCIDMNAWYSRVDLPEPPGLRAVRPRPARGARRVRALRPRRPPRARGAGRRSASRRT